jgi:muramoyltetrapeptide carboxypeptidase LdcA involved in peptidoglycan recycling
MITVEQAKKVLKDAGYQVNNLWHIEDVKQNYNCTDEEAMEVLVEALDNEATIEQIFFAVNFHAEEQGLTKIEE